MIKGTVQIDNKPVKYKFKVASYTDRPDLGYYILEYKTNKIFYNCIFIKEYTSVEWKINVLERMSKDKFEKEIIKHIAKDINDRKLKKKYC